MFLQSKVAIFSISVIYFLGLYRYTAARGYSAAGTTGTPTPTSIIATTIARANAPLGQLQSTIVFQKRSRLTPILPINKTNSAGNTTFKYWNPDLKFTSPGKSLRKNYGTQMGDFENIGVASRETSEKNFLKVDVTPTVNRNKIDEETKKNKQKKKTTMPNSGSSTEMEEKSTTAIVVGSTGGNKLKPRSHSSTERFSRKRPGSSVEKTEKRGAGDFWGKKHDFWEESDFEQKSKRRPQKYSSTEKKTNFDLGKDVFIDSTEEKVRSKQKKYLSDEKQSRYSSTEKKSTFKPESEYIADEYSTEKRPKFGPTRDSSYERRPRVKHSSAEKRTKPIKYSHEKWIKRRPGSDSSREKKNKKFKQNSKEQEQLRTKSRDKFIRTKSAVYSEVEKQKSKLDSDTSVEDNPKPTQMGYGDSQDNNKNQPADDFTEERNDNKLEPGDQSEEQLRQPRSSASFEDSITTRHTTQRKSRNKGREKYLNKRKKALRSTIMSKFYQDQKLADSDVGDKSNESNRGEIADEYIIHYLNPYASKVDFEKAASQVEGISNVQVEVVGRTAEYNDIVMLKLTGSKKNTFRFRADAREDKYLDEPPEKKIILIVHGLSVYGMLNVECLSQMKPLKRLMSYYAKHLDKFDIYLIPLANPDGFTYAQQLSLWSKNMSPQAICPGVQVDRNFEVAWKDDPNINSCDQHYPGPTPFSEAESRAVRDILHKYGQRIVAFINVHSGTEDETVFKGDAVLFPKGYADSNEDTDRYLDLQGEIEEMMRNASFRHLSIHVNSLKAWYGKVRGTSVDYASSVYGIPYALEFVMQPYPNNAFFSYLPNYSDLALKQIWQRVIDVVFNNIHSNHQDQVGFKKL